MADLLVEGYQATKNEGLEITKEFDSLDIESQLSPRFDDVLWPFLDYFKGTYTKLRFPIAPRIDFLFVSAALGRKNARVIPKYSG